MTDDTTDYANESAHDTLFLKSRGVRAIHHFHFHWTYPYFFTPDLQSVYNGWRQ